jgi:hypothetical protein
LGFPYANENACSLRVKVHRLVLQGQAAAVAGDEREETLVALPLRDAALDEVALELDHALECFNGKLDVKLVQHG